MPSRGQQLGKLLNPTGDIVETSLPPKIETFSQSVSDTGKIEKAALGNDVSTIEQVSDTSLLTASGNSVGDQRVVGNNLYIWNGSGWFRIALINETPTWDSDGQPSSTYILDADSPQDATVITLAATDPDGFPINYSYVTGGSMDSIATVSQDSSIFTITPKTAAQAPDGGTGTITFRASDGINILPYVSSFTLEFITIITDSKYTTLLATATGTSDNNNITDASSNNHTLTVNGDVHAGTFSPYRRGDYSTYFDGAGDYLQLSSVLPSGAFTVSCWAYFNTSNPAAVWSQGTSGNAGRVSIQMLGTRLFFGIGSTNVQSISFSIVPKTWYHIEAQYSGSQIELFLNGSSVGIASNTTNPQSTNFHVGTLGSSWDSSYELDGYVSDLKVVSGTPSGSSTVPTEPLSSSGSALHICHLPYIADGSTNNYSITVNGNVSIKPFSPYDYVKYSATDHGGSVYFDGSGDYLVASNNTDTFGTGDFTLEGWIYRTATGYIWQSIVAQRNGASTSVNEFVWGVNNSGYMYFYTGAHVASTAAGVIKLNQWHHIAFTRSGSTLRQFVDGIQQVSGTSSNNLTYGPMSIGNNNGSSELLTGFLSDIKITKGTALYTSNFTPPTEPISSANSLLHIKGTDASIIDKSQGSNLKLIGNTTGSTTQVKFANTKSMYFDGTGDMTHSVLPFPLASKATIEFWMYSSATNKRYVFGIGLYTASSVLGIDTGSGTFSLRATSGGSGTTTQIIAGGAFSANTWYHVAIVKNNTTYELYVDGISKGVGAYGAANTYDSSYDVTIGSLSSDGTSASYPWSGYIQDFRITNGLRRYISNFTPPTKSLEG